MSQYQEKFRWKQKPSVQCIVSMKTPAPSLVTMVIYLATTVYLALQLLDNKVKMDGLPYMRKGAWRFLKKHRQGRSCKMENSSLKQSFPVIVVSEGQYFPEFETCFRT